MIFDLSNEYDLPKFKEYIKKLLDNKPVVEIKKKYPKRTLAQNSYFYLILSWFACETGYSVEEVKVDIFKRQCNRQLFEREIVNKRGVKIKTLISSSELTTAEFSTAIERFRNWSASQGIYLPSPNEDQFLLHIQKEIERNKEYL